MVQSVEKFYPIILREAVREPDPWKSLEISGRLAQVNKSFLKFVEEELRPEILEGLLPGLDAVRVKWLGVDTEAFGRRLADSGVLRYRWRAVVTPQVYKALRIIRRKAQYGNRWYDLSFTGLILSPFAMFGLLVREALETPDAEDRSSSRILGLIYGGAIGCYLLCWGGRQVYRRLSEAVELRSFRSAESEVEEIYYPQKGFDPLEHKLKKIVFLDFHRLVRSRSFKTKRDAFIGCVLYGCVRQAIKRFRAEEISKEETYKAIGGMSVLWDVYRKVEPIVELQNPIDDSSSEEESEIFLDEDSF